MRRPRKALQNRYKVCRSVPTMLQSARTQIARVVLSFPVPRHRTITSRQQAPTIPQVGKWAQSRSECCGGFGGYFFVGSSGIPTFQFSLPFPASFRGSAAHFSVCRISLFVSRSGGPPLLLG